jgi:starch phosphorylase
MQPIDPAAPPETDGFEILVELALDLRSAWNHRADRLWEEIDATMWRETGNPWLVMQSASRARLRELWATSQFRDDAQELLQARRHELAAPQWFQLRHRDEALTSVAFFSLEFAVAEALPLYSGGLGNVAGDYLKAASDLGVPLVGVGLLYQQGYFRQSIDASGAQRELWPFNQTRYLPISPLRNADGAWVRVRLPRPGPAVWLRGWQARVGRVALYLLDSDDPSNTPADRGITGQLYGGDEDVRLLQEMALGIGGWRLLRAAGLRPEVCHLNEGHAAFAALERARDFMQEHTCSFDVALAATRAGNLFTTHTPVESGFDRFAPDLVEAHLGAYARDELGVELSKLLAMGRVRPEDAAEPMTTAWLATHCSGAVTAVSRRHAEVSRQIFQAQFPRWPEGDVPVGYVTNGIHVPSWDSEASDALWTRACGVDRWDGGEETVGSKIAACSDAALWAFRASARADLVAFVRERLSLQLAAAGFRGARLDVASRVLDRDTLTLGLARRFVEYKRPTLLLHDPERFVRLLCDARRPVQIVVAGKAHPRDEQGKALVAEWLRFARRADVRMRVVFLADYDLRLAEHLVQGVDLWINTPRPPWEACGTSGMKVLVNGGVNLSSLDGWWAEAYRPEVGWAIEGDGHDDAQDAAHLYELLERDVIPAFYERDPAGLPSRWVARMRASMASLTARYSASRALRDYTDGYYLPAAREYALRAANGGQQAASLVRWEDTLRRQWPGLRFGEVRVRTEGSTHSFAATVYLGELDPDAVAIELYADGDKATGPTRVALRRGEPLVGARGFSYVGEVASARPSWHFTLRAVPSHSGVAVPLELPLIVWQR